MMPSAINHVCMNSRQLSTAPIAITLSDMPVGGCGSLEVRHRIGRNSTPHGLDRPGWYYWYNIVNIGGSWQE
ncbi:hypothetical protein VTL71DRAFT_8894 [Oculimacula yallundae]|uniref:Uncharacterized protein n=1 Tax=Oculimacula yallundae TaxID=86028 RepID=A0ABR4BTZ9_9HELO